MASILIFGGVRPLGRAVVMQALRSRIYQYIRVVDMALPQAEFLQDDELVAFEDVELIQAQLGDADGERIADLAFVHPAGRVWSVVVNAHVESRNAVDYESHLVRSIRPAYQIALAAKRHSCGVLIHLTLAASTKWTTKMGILKEDHVLEKLERSPRSRSVVEAEALVRSVSGLSAVILRVGEPYGEGFLGSVSNIILTCKLYQDSGTKVFALPYKKDEYFNTVHTLDIARAAIHAGRWYVEEKVRGLRVFNVVDHSDSTMVDILANSAAVMGMKWELASAVSRGTFRVALRFNWLVHAMNKQFHPSWKRLLMECGVTSTPLIGCMDPENLSTAWGMRLSGEAFRKETGFTLERPFCDEVQIKEAVNYWRRMGAWPDRRE